MAKYAMIIVDMLNDFITGPISTERARTIVEQNRILIEAARQKGYPVIYANDCHTKEIDHEFVIWGPHAVEGTEGAEVIKELAPQDGDYVVPKKRYSAFYETSMTMLLKELGVDTVIITGWQADCCCRHTAADAFFRGYNIVIPKEATDTDSEEAYQYALGYFEKFYGAKVCSVDDVLAMF